MKSIAWIANEKSTCKNAVRKRWNQTAANIKIVREITKKTDYFTNLHFERTNRSNRSNFDCIAFENKCNESFLIRTFIESQ